MNPKNFLPRPVSTGPWSTLAYVAGGVVLAGIAWIGLTGGGEPEAVKVEALAPVASAEAAPAGASARPSPVARNKAAPKSPNLIGDGLIGQEASPSREATVSAEFAKKLKNRARYAERLLAKEKKKNSRLEDELSQLRGRVDRLTMAKQPPPPTEAEEVLETLRPLLSANAPR